MRRRQQRLANQLDCQHIGKAGPANRWNRTSKSATAETDLVAEDRRGRIVGIEVKASVGINQQAFRGLRYLQQRQPDRFVAGVVLYCGSESLPFGPGLQAMPISALWTT